MIYIRGVKLIFTRGHISLEVAFKGPNVILGLYKCKYSLTVKRELGTGVAWKQGGNKMEQGGNKMDCLLYTSDAADDPRVV